MEQKIVRMNEKHQTEAIVVVVIVDEFTSSDIDRDEVRCL